MEDGQIDPGDPELLAWALMGIGELVGMRWILWAGRDELPPEVLDELGRIVTRTIGSRDGGPMTRVGLVATAHYLPERWMTAAEVGAASGIPEEVIVEKFGLRGKHIAADDEHVSDLAVAAGRRLLDETQIDPSSIGVVLYYGSTWKDYAVWQAAPWIAHRLGCVERVRDRVRQRLDGHARRASVRPSAARRGAGAAQRPARRGVSRVVPPRLRERALAVHVQLRRRRGRRAAVGGRGREPAARARTASRTARSRSR